MYVCMRARVCDVCTCVCTDGMDMQSFDLPAEDDCTVSPLLRITHWSVNPELILLSICNSSIWSCVLVYILGI